MRTASISICIACLCIASLAAGCGSSTMTVDPVTPNLAIQKDPRATGKELKLSVEEFKSARDTKRGELAIGEAKTGAFNTSTVLLAEESPEKMVTAAVRDALVKAGFSLVESQNADYVVAGEVSNFWVEEYATGASLEYAKAFVRFDVTLADKNGKILWGTTKEKYQTSSQCWDATAQDIPMLTSALTQTVAFIIDDQSFWLALSK